MEGLLIASKYGTMSQNHDDERLMRMAIEQAWMGKNTPGGSEVGCVIARDGELLASGFNEADLRNDPTAHAEIVTLRRLGEKLKRIEFRDCTIYCTLQCCTMCTAACIWAKVKRIVYGATRTDVHSMYFDSREFDTSDLISSAFKDDIEVVGGVLAAECSRLYVPPSAPVPLELQPNR